MYTLVRVSTKTAIILGILSMILLDSVLIIGLLQLKQDPINIDDQQVCISLNKAFIDSDIVLDNNA